MGGRSFDTTSGAFGDTLLNSRHGYHVYWCCCLVWRLLLLCLVEINILFARFSVNGVCWCFWWMLVCFIVVWWVLLSRMLCVGVMYWWCWCIVWLVMVSYMVGVSLLYGWWWCLVWWVLVSCMVCDGVCILYSGYWCLVYRVLVSCMLGVGVLYAGC